MVKDKTLYKIEKPLDVFFKYAIPIIAFIVGIALEWATQVSTVKQQALAIEELQDKDTFQDTQFNAILQAVNDIKVTEGQQNTKLDNIQKIVDKL